MNPKEFEHPEGASEPVIQRTRAGGDHDLKREMTERPPITPELREKYDRQLTTLAQLMKEAGTWWQLDGMMNVSLYRKQKGGDYIGQHADIDMAVRRDELQKLEGFFRSRGYGLFIRAKDGDFRDWRRVGHKAFHPTKGWSPHIVAIDDSGVIRDSELKKVEISIIDFDQEGFPLANGVRYPKEWLGDRIMSLKGEEIHLSHPARLVMWKIWMNRGYDEKDFDLLAETNALTDKDVDDVEAVLREMARHNWWDKAPGFDRESAAIKARLGKLRGKN